LSPTFCINFATLPGAGFDGDDLSRIADSLRQQQREVTDVSAGIDAYIALLNNIPDKFGQSGFEYVAKKYDLVQARIARSPGEFAPVLRRDSAAKGAHGAALHEKSAGKNPEPLDGAGNKWARHAGSHRAFNHIAYGVNHDWLP
jgi:hypothetical protein